MKFERVTIESCAAPQKYAIVDGPFGSNLKITDYVQAGIPVLQGKNITGNKFNFEDVRFITEKKAEELKRSSVRKGDILVVKIGSIGYSAKVDDLKGYNFAIIPANLAKITLNEKKVDSGYFVHFLNSPDFVRELRGISSKTAQPAISLKKLKGLTIPLPTLLAQKQIAEMLDAADSLRQKDKALVAKYDELTQSLFLEMFGDFEQDKKGFIKTTVGDALNKKIIEEIQDGNHGELHPKSSDFLAEGIPMIFANSLTGNILDYKDGHHLSGETVNGLRIGFAKAGDVLLTHKGSIGLTDVVPDDVELLVLSPQVTYYRLNTLRLNPVYLKFFFLTPYFFRQLEKYSKQSTRAYIGITKQKILPVVIPPISLQDDFVRRIRLIEKQKSLAQVGLKKSEELFEGLLGKVFKV